MIGSANRNADPLSPRVLSPGLLCPKPFRLGATHEPTHVLPLRRNQPHPTCAIPAALRRGQTLTILSSPRVVDAALSSRIDQALFIASGRHAGRYDNRARRQSQFLDGSESTLQDTTAPELTPQKGPTPTGCENRSASPRKPSWRSDVVHDQIATLPCAATDLAGRTMGGRPLSPRRGAY